MRPLLSMLLILALTAPASAADWTFEDAGGVPIAYVDNGKAQFQFACRGGDLAMGFWVRAPHRTVASAASLNLAITPDGGDASFAQDMPLIHSDGTSMIVRGPVARAWAGIAQRARTTLRVAYVRKQNALEYFDSADFAVGGSASAIRQVLDRCG
jgi:hypothetical protein